VTTGSSTSNFRKSQLINYEVSKLVKHTVNPYGDIKKMSVAVILDDGMKVEQGQGGSSVRKAVPRTADELKKFKDVVAAAIGIDNTRGDLLTVENIAFDSQISLEEVKPTFWDNWREYLQPAIKYGSFILLFLLVYLLMVRPVTRKVFAPVTGVLSPEEEAQQALREGGQPPLALEAPKTVKELEAALAAGESALPLPKVDLRKADILKQRIIELVQKEPESGAQLLRVWLTEEGKQ
jgi:flagellar M-ring protein FliF